MSTRQPRFEIVRTDAGFHARFRASNGRIVWTTEVYQRRRGALNAIKSMVDPFSGCWVDRWYDRRRKVDVDAVLYRSSSWEKTDAVRLEVRDVDDRQAVTA